MDELCGSPFWDKNITWSTDNPRFTPCFERSVLLWIPCSFLWLFLPFEMYYILSSKNGNIGWNRLNKSKLSLTICLIGLSIIDISYTRITSPKSVTYTIENMTEPVKILTFSLAAVLLIYNKKYGLRTSGLLFIFWFLLALCNIPRLLSEIANYNNEEYEEFSLYTFISYTIYFLIVLLIFVLNCFADEPPLKSQYKIQENPCPEERSSYLSKIFYIWVDKLIWTGFRRIFTANDMWSLHPENESEILVKSFLENWNRGIKRQNCAHTTTYFKKNEDVNFNTNMTKTRVSLLKTLLRTFGALLFFSSILRLFSDALLFVAPQILDLLISFIETDEPLWKGFLYTGILFGSAILQSIILSQYLHKMVIIGMKIRTSITDAVYRKTLKLSNNARKEYTTGEIVNLMAVDANRFAEVMITINHIWASPLQILFALYFLWEILGPSVLAGLAITIIVLPLNAIIGNRLRILQMTQMFSKDERVKLMNEVLSGIKVLKLYAWEPSFENKILQVREKEIKVLEQSAYLNTATFSIWYCAPYLVTLATFATYVLLDPNNILDSKTAFVSLSLFNILRLPMHMLPTVITNIIQSYVSIQRLENFLNADEINSDDTKHDFNENYPLIIENGTFSWGSDEPILHNINLKIPSGRLIAVIGSVGCGKSSLLSVFLGEMDKLVGRVNTYGSIAYVPQQAWIQNTTVEKNILFGKNMDTNVYNTVINACALGPDLDILPEGDQTLIGERGINLSGGQKQRISLARAVYYDNDIYLLDDPLSAVDPNVGKHLFKEVIGPSGVLKWKTRVLVTHSITYLTEVDNIVVLKDGKISDIGTYDELIRKGDGFADFLLQHSSSENANSKHLDEIDRIDDTLKQMLRKDLLNGGVSDDVSKDKVLKLKKKELTEDEKIETGEVKWEVYYHYFKNVGLCTMFIVLSTSIMFQAFSIGSNVWLSEWSMDKDVVVNGTNDSTKRDLYLGIYGFLGFCQVISLSISFLILFIGAKNASVILHKSMLCSVLKAPMNTFFDITPIGRILNRFSKEVDVMDNTMPSCFRHWIACLFNVLATLFVVSLSTPLFIAVIIPIGLLYYVIQKLYVTTSRQLKRLDSASKSPIYSHFGESINGVTSIRAYGVENIFIKESEKRIDYNQTYYYPCLMTNRWLAIRLEITGNLVVLFSALFAVIQKETANAGMVGLSISYAMQITRNLSWLVRASSDVETNIVAIERIKEYTDIAQEAPWKICKTVPKSEWPAEGSIKIENLIMKYKPTSEPVLYEINCEIKSGEKIGIVGRTGAGKSTLTHAFFRIMEPHSGRIIIDSIDISTLGLHSLRSRITIIPQDPVLFSGSLRSNLDPFAIYSDNMIWSALEYAHLKDFVSNLPEGLNHVVYEGGENLSVGQRQLICLARALLRKTKMLILDEATAAVDLETDDLIQRTIKTEFSSCTILTIAHRLNTIMNSDKVLVLHMGKLMEFDKPESLLQNKNSIFYNMAKAANLVE